MSLTVAHSFPVWLPQTQTWLYHQARHLPPDRISAHVICRVTRNLDQFALSPIHSLYTAASPLSRLSERFLRNTDFHAYNALVCRQINADILHSHFGPIAWKNMKMLDMVRSPGRMLPKHIVTFYGQDVDRLPKTHPSWINRYKELFSRVDAVLCEGPHMAEKVQALGCDPKRIGLHRLGVSLQNRPFTPPVKQPNEPFKVLMAAAFRPKKGLLDGLKALDMVSQRFDLQVTLVGESTGEPDSEQEKARIHSFLADSSLGSGVHLAGFVTAEQLDQMARDHHIYLCPSKQAPDGDTEGGAPVSLIEMAASGLPVVSTRHADIPDIIEHGVSGLLARENDPESLAQCVETLFSNVSEWAGYAHRAREVVEARHNAVQQGELLSNIYEQVYCNTFVGNKKSALVKPGNQHKPRILFVSHSDGLYGAEKSLLTLLEGLQHRNEFELRVLLPGTGPLFEELTQRGIPVLVRGFKRWAGNRFRLAGSAWRTWNNRRVLADLVNETRRWQPHIIYSNSLATPAGARLAQSMGPGCRHVWHIREALWEREWGFMDAGVEKSMALVQASSDLLVCNSEFIKRNMLRLLASSPNTVAMHVVYNGVVPSETHRRHPSEVVVTDRPAPEQRLQLLVAGSISPLKNIGEAIQAMHILHNEQKRSVFLDIRGDGPASERRRLKKLVHRLGLQQQIRFLPYANSMAEVFANAHLLLVPSKNESFGRIAVEAMAAGLVVIAADRGGLPEIVEHGKTGLLYESGRPEALAACIGMAADDPKLYAHLARKGSETAFARYAESDYIDKISALLLSLLSERNPG